MNHINPPESIWTKVPTNRTRISNTNRIPLIKLIGDCQTYQCRCDDEDCIERAVKHINSSNRSINSVEDENFKDVNELNQDYQGWENIRAHVDSGAVDTVGPNSIGRAFETKDTVASTCGNTYIAAHGSVIKQYGERLIKGETDNGLNVSMPVQIADVNTVLMSRHKMNDTVLNVMLDASNSFFVENTSGTSIPIKYDNGRYFFDTLGTGTC